MGVTLAGLAEGMALADRAGLQQKDVMEVSWLTSRQLASENWNKSMVEDNLVLGVSQYPYQVLELTGLACPTILGKGKAIIDGGFPTHQPLQHMQKVSK